MSKYPQIDIQKVKTISVKERKSKVQVEKFARPVDSGVLFSDFWDSLPDILVGQELKSLITTIKTAKLKSKPVIFMMGAHVIKTGLNPIVIDLMRRGFIQCLVMNGAGVVHDFELAWFGQTSEDVAEAIRDGSFGMVRETADLINSSLEQGSAEGFGFGEAMGDRICKDNPQYAHLSLLGRAYELNIPVTVHVALGTDIVHQHPNANGEVIGGMSLRDFHILSHVVAGLHEGGVVLLFGSSVLLPEVFLKALTVARNIQGPIRNFTTAVFDMNRHYRPQMNVADRPTQEGGAGYYFTGHHEIMLPLLAAALIR